MCEKYGEKILKEREDSIKRITQYLIEGLKYGNLKIKAEPIGLEVLTVNILDEEGYELLEIWTGNKDEELSHMTTYNDSVYFPEVEKRKELMDLIIQHLKK